MKMIINALINYVFDIKLIINCYTLVSLSKKKNNYNNNKKKYIHIY